MSAPRFACSCCLEASVAAPGDRCASCVQRQSDDLTRLNPELQLLRLHCSDLVKLLSEPKVDAVLTAWDREVRDAISKTSTTEPHPSVARSYKEHLIMTALQRKRYRFVATRAARLAVEVIANSDEEARQLALTKVFEPLRRADWIDALDSVDGELDLQEKEHVSVAE